MSDYGGRGEGRERAPACPPREIPAGPVAPQRVSGSESIKSVASAIRRARVKFSRVIKDKANPHHKSRYADLAQVLDAVDDALEAEALIVLQSTRWEAGELWLDTTIEHDDSGEWLASVWPLLSSDYRNPQKNGSALTYGRRYVLLMMLGIAPEDDDGNAGASQGHGQAPARRPEPHREQSPPHDEKRRVREEIDRAVERETWSRWIGETLRKANAEWMREMVAEGVDPATRAENKELSNEPRAVNHLCSLMIEKGLLDAASVTKRNEQGKTVRDPKRCREYVTTLFQSNPKRVKASIAQYLVEKRSRLRAELSMLEADEVDQLEPAGVGAGEDDDTAIGARDEP